ncbi:MAG: hypothetical protein FWG23_02005 [Eggerthellaceae bacterium]|nr:hypothetical protein [Eggerthellaceae bacterium]
MLQYIRKYLVLYYACAVTPALLFFAASAFGPGATSPLSPFVLVVTLVTLATSSVAASHLFNNKAGKRFRELLLILNDECDPVRFLDEGRTVAKGIKAPFNDWGSLFNASYAAAHIEVGDTGRAREVIDSMRISAEAAKKPVVAGRICLNMHEPIKLLYGHDFSIRCLDEAESLIRQAPEDPEFEHCIGFIQGERSLDVAERDGDTDALLALTDDILQNKRVYARAKVRAAFSKAEAYRKLGDREGERQWLAYVAENGNHLQAAATARARLAAF